MENDLRQSLLKTKDPIESKYLKYIDWEFDYEFNNFLDDHFYKKWNKNEEEKNKNGINNETFKLEKPQNNNIDFSKEEKISYCLDSFKDELAPRYYKCEPICCLKKKLFKGLVSKKKIRLINKDFDLDLM